jgi:hypothetical protein
MRMKIDSPARSEGSPDLTNARQVVRGWDFGISRMVPGD